MQADLNAIYRGHFPLNMISKRDMSWAINFIRANLSRSEMPLYSARSSFTEVIKMNSFIINRIQVSDTRQALLVTIPFPLSISDSSFILYIIELVCMPVENVAISEQKYASVILNLPKFIAWNYKDKDWW